MDPASQSNIHQVQTKHIHLNLQASFETKTLQGYVDLKVEVLQDQTAVFVLDTNELSIQQATIDDEPVEFRLLEPHQAFGTGLEISLPPAKQIQGVTFQVKIHYSTTLQSSGIQFLTKDQTAEKTYPYMFTQAQAIHARSILPCQDAPSIKTTYSAAIAVPEWATCLMSAVAIDASKPEAHDGQRTYHWEQKVPIPSYLIAMVIGQLESREIGPRTRVWAEPSVVRAAAYEFQQTEDFIQHAEKIMAQEYVWGRYDLVCLPPSFPYGGMENPCLTFVTPTLLTCDREMVDGKETFSKGKELVDVVAHEIAHSWTGNLITNHTWDHFWLNEGWTVWLQRKIMARVHSKEYFDFDSIIGWKSLHDSVHRYGVDHEFTKLVPVVEGSDPDDAFSVVPYEKGFNFLYYLSRTIGEEEFEEFAQAYVQEFKYKTVTTESFIAFFKKHCDEKSLDYSAVDWEGWTSKPGMPIVTPEFDTSISSVSNELAEKWINGGENCSAADIEGWTSAQLVVMLEKILLTMEEKNLKLDAATLEKMGSLYNFSASKNAEVRLCWQTMCIRSEASFITPQVEAFLKEQGRMKFIRPLYRDLVKSKFGKEDARRIFDETKLNYHPIAQKMIARDLA